MADIALTAANVLASATASITRFKAGVAITAGQVLFQDTDSTVKLADSNGTAPANTVLGIALNGAAIGQPVSVVSADTALAIGGTVTQGELIVLSATPGAICPVSDLASGDIVIFLGGGVGSNKIYLHIFPLGVAVP